MSDYSEALSEFHSETQLQVKSSWDVYGGYEKNHFTTLSLERLAEAEEVFDLDLFQFEGVGKNRKKVQLDAYGSDGVDSSLIFVITDYSSESSFQTITTSEVASLFESLRSFCELALDDDLAMNLERSSAAYSVAIDFRERFGAANKIRFYLVSNRKLSTRVKSLPTSQIGGKPIEQSIWDLQRFNDSYNSRKGREDIEINLTDWVPDGIPALESSHSDELGITTYLMVIPGKVLADIYETHGSRLLEGNVRSFLSVRGAVNKGIRTTILSKPELFLAYNNGLTSTATGVEKTDTKAGLRLTKIHGLQIVNGGQTTASLYSFLKQEKEKIGNLNHVDVQIKLIDVDPKLAEEMVPNIARYANTQNKVSEADFFSNSPFHIRMEEISRRIIANPKPNETIPTRWFYERARGSYLNDKSRQRTAAMISKFEREHPLSQKITKTDLAKFSNTWNLKPHIVSRGAQKNFVDFANEVADRFANESTRDEYSDSYFKRIVAIDLLWQGSQKSIRNAEWNETGYLANIVTYSIAKFAYEVKSLELDLDWDKIWKTQFVDESIIKNVTEIGRVVRQILTDETRTNSNVTEWAKTETCWKRVQGATVSISEQAIESLVMSGKIEKSARKVEEKKLGKALGEVELLSYLLSFDSDTFSKIADTPSLRVSPTELDIMKVFLKNKYVSTAQGKRLYDLLERAKSEGII